MKLEQQVISLELSKKLKELGVKQESLFYWRLRYSWSESFDNGKPLGKMGEFGDYHIEYYPKPRYTTADVKWNEKDLRKLEETEASAFTVAELGEMLPASVFIKDNEVTGKGGGNIHLFPIKYDDNDDELGLVIYVIELGSYKVREKTEANVRAKMLIYLLENNQTIGDKIK